jgi:hypothetical protein
MKNKHFMNYVFSQLKNQLKWLCLEKQKRKFKCENFSIKKEKLKLNFHIEISKLIH